MLFSGSSLGLRLQNATGSGNGNDAAFDNIAVTDVTPRLDRTFASSTAPTGGSATLTFTVTNTSERGAKSGWGFTDTLPAGLTPSSTTVGGTCNATSRSRPEARSW